MHTPRMDHDSSQSAPLAGLPPNSQDLPTREMRSSARRDQSGNDKEGQRSRASSTAKSDLSSSTTSQFNRARGPINEAVHSALDPLDPNHTAIPPDVLNHITSQITANVLQQLKGQFPSTNAASKMGDHMELNSSLNSSPPLDRDRTHTPPSPYRASEEAAQTGTQPSPKKQAKYQPSPDLRRPPSPPFSHGTLSDSDSKEKAYIRARVETSSLEGDMTLLEKIWGELFDGQGRSTTRLSQFLRGIAVHIIEDYDPKHSLVITPDKMQRYYDETKLPNEMFPWQVVFDDRTSSISRLFRDIEVQHHLVQDRLDERPDIPGMTPIGFETWMTFVLKANPDEEFERLAYTALHMPISNPDDRKERFPKELSRRLFPKDADSTLGSRLSRVLYAHCGVQALTRSGSMSEKDTKSAYTTTRAQEPHLSSSYTGAPPQKSAPFDNTLSQTSTRSSIPDIDPNMLRPTVSEVAVEDSPIDMMPPMPIERQRKPYTATAGGGKNYDNVNNPIVQPAQSKSTHSGPPPPVKLTRSASMSNGRPSERARPTQPISIHHNPQGEVPPSPSVKTRSGSQYHRDGPPRRAERNRSPSSSRTNENPPRTDADVSYGSYGSTGGGDYMSTPRRAENRFENRDRRSSITETRDRDYEPRPRYHSVSNNDGHRYYAGRDYPVEDEHHRHSNSSYVPPDAQHPSGPHYPPSSYKGRT